MIEVFKFEVMPLAYAGLHGGVEKVLHISVSINGESHDIQKVVPNAKVWESEIDFYMRLASETIKEYIKKNEGVSE